MTPATLTALAAELRTLAGPDLIAAAQQAAAILDHLSSADGVDVVAWQVRKLIPGRGTYQPARWSEWQQLETQYGKSLESMVAAWEAETGQRTCEARRLVAQSDHLAALSKALEVADGLRAELEAVKRDAKAISQAEVSKAARFISDRQSKECNVDADDNWKVYGDEFIEDVTDMLKHIGFSLTAHRGSRSEG